MGQLSKAIVRAEVEGRGSRVDGWLVWTELRTYGLHTAGFRQYSAARKRLTRTTGSGRIYRSFLNGLILCTQLSKLEADNIASPLVIRLKLNTSPLKQA